VVIVPIEKIIVMPVPPKEECLNKNLTVRLPVGLAQEIEEIAAITGYSRDDVINNLLKCGIKNKDAITGDKKSE